MANARRVGWLAALNVAIVAAIVATAKPAHAHAVGLSRGDYVLAGSAVTAELTFARAEGETLDAESLVRGVRVSAGGMACAGSVAGSSPVEPDGIAWRMRFACERARGKLEVELPLLEELAHGHRHVARVQAGGGAVEEVLYRGHAGMGIEVGEGSAGVGVRAGAGAGAGASVSTGARFVGMLRMGVEHIIPRGYDHIVFLFGLVLVGGRKRSLLKAVTAFTLAHSVTLGVAALGVWTPPPSVIEPAIALSIAYVGVENFFVKNADARWRLTLPFGLVHGFGFAGALREIALPRAEVPLALFSFNLGIEVAQVAVLAAMLLLLAALRRLPRFEGVGVRALSVATAAVGAFWFVLRIAGA